MARIAPLRRCASPLALALVLALLAVPSCAPGESDGGGGESAGDVSEAAASEPGSASEPGEEEAAATVNGETITVGELDAFIKERLFERATQGGDEAKLHELRSSALQDMIRKRLVAQEAEAQGTSSQALLQEQSEASGSGEVTDSEVRAFYERHSEQLGKVPFEKVAPQIRRHLQKGSGADAARQYASQLREDAEVTVHLEAPRVDVAATGASRGPEDAPVTIVEFSDYECPYCRRAEPTLEKLRARYPEQVQFVYRHFPLERAHKKARKAAEAAECAEAQGKFWAYHDLLFEHSPDLGPEKLVAYAKDVEGLDVAAFESCLDEGRFRDEVQQDLEAGRAAGVTGTPAFFVNGIPMSGAQPLEKFVEVIEGELERVGAKGAAGSEASGTTG